MEILFKNREKQALLEELFTICQSMAKHGLPEDLQRMVKGSARLGLTYRTSQSENALYIDLVTLDNQALQPFTIQVYMKDNTPWVHLYYFDKSKVNRKVDIPLTEVQTTLVDLISGIPSQSRVVAFKDSLRFNLRNFVYWVD